MIIKEELKYWLKTGHLKHIPYGISRQQLIELLGPPTWGFTHSTNEFPCLYGWGKFEFHFWDDTIDSSLEGVVFKAYTGPADKSNLCCNYHRLSRRSNINKVISFLHKQNIEFEEKPTLWPSEDEKLLVTEGYAEIVFDSHPGYFVLDKIVRFRNHDQFYAPRVD